MDAGTPDSDDGLTEVSADKAPAPDPEHDGPEAGQGRTPRLTLDGFDGPLERLLTLARARQIDLARLSLAALLDQLTAALRHAPAATPLGEKADWVVMAAWLVQLRSLLLLPADAPARLAAEVEANQLRDRLIELRAMQALAVWLQQRPQRGRDVFVRGRPEVFGVAFATPPPFDVIAFLWASLALFDDDRPDVADKAHYRPRWWDLHAIPEARTRILRLLTETPDGQAFETLLPEATDPAGGETQSSLRHRSAWTSTFIASLELAKQGNVTLTQPVFLASIHVKPAASEECEGVSDREGDPC